MTNIPYLGIIQIIFIKKQLNNSSTYLVDELYPTLCDPMD